jgi:hypothetical protein
MCQSRCRIVVDDIAGDYEMFGDQGRDRPAETAQRLPDLRIELSRIDVVG